MPRMDNNRDLKTYIFYLQGREGVYFEEMDHTINCDDYADSILYDGDCRRGSGRAFF